MSKSARLLMALLIIVIASLLAYSPALRAGFIWDDDSYVYENTLLQSVDGLHRIWFKLGATPDFYPLTFTTFWLEYHLWQLSPFGYHLVNVLLHIINATLLWWLLSRLSIPGAWLAAAVFALHPVNVESVAWITERKNVLCGVFYLLSFHAFLRFYPLDAAGPPLRYRWPFYILSLMLYFLAMLSKTVAVTLPAVFLVVIWWKKNRLKLSDIKFIVPYLLLAVPLSLVGFWTQRNIIGAVGAKWDFTILERLLIAARALWFYVAKLLWPARLAFIYPRWHIDSSVWWQYLFVLGIVAVPLTLWFLKDKIGRGPLAAVLFYALTLFPASGLFNIYWQVYSFVADHIQYIAAAGLTASIVALVYRILTRLNLQKSNVAKLAVFAILTTLGTLTFRQCHIYENTETLWRDTLQKNPDSWMAHNNLGAEYHMQEKFDDALYHYRQAIRIDPDSEKAHYNIAIILEMQGRLDEAIKHYTDAVNIAPNYDQAQLNLAKALQSQGKIDPAINHYRTYIRLRPENAQALNNLALLTKSKGNIDKAAEYFRRAIKADPNFAEAHNNLANIFVSKGLLDEAVTHYQKALAIRPDYMAAHHNLARTFESKGLLDDAVTHAQYAAELTGFSDPQVLNTLAAAYAASGRYDKAVKTAQKALKLASADKNTELINYIQNNLQSYRKQKP